MPQHTFSVVFGAVVARGLDYRDTFQVFRPGFELYEEREKRAAVGQPEWFGEGDLYPDARPTLGKLRDDGLWVGIAGNQTVRAGRILGELELPADFLATSDDWGVSKPDPEFFRRLVGAAPCEAGEILYVGDRMDNDIRSAVKVGLKMALIRRGPWAQIQWEEPEARSLPTWRIDSLEEFPGLVAAFNAGGC